MLYYYLLLPAPPLPPAPPTPPPPHLPFSAASPPPLLPPPTRYPPPLLSPPLLPPPTRYLPPLLPPPTRSSSSSSSSSSYSVSSSSSSCVVPLKREHLDCEAEDSQETQCRIRAAPDGHLREMGKVIMTWTLLSLLPFSLIELESRCSYKPFKITASVLCSLEFQYCATQQLLVIGLS